MPASNETYGLACVDTAESSLTVPIDSYIRLYWASATCLLYARTDPEAISATFYQCRLPVQRSTISIMGCDCVLFVPVYRTVVSILVGEWVNDAGTDWLVSVEGHHSSDDGPMQALKRAYLFK